MEEYLLPKLLERVIAFLPDQEKSKFTIIAYKKDIEQFVGYLASIEKNDIRDIKKEDIENFIRSLIDKNYTKKSASRKLNSIRTFFRFLKHEAIITANPAFDISHPKYTQNQPRVLTKMEYRALRDVAKEDVRTYALVELLLQTGIKIGELATLRLQDIENDRIRIRKYGKNIERDIPLNKAAIQAINLYKNSRNNKADDDTLFVTRTGKPLLIRNIRQIIDKCFLEVGIEKATVNDLRNTFIAHQLKNGATLEYISNVVGHRRISSTERFLTLVKQEAERKEKLGEL
jgi:site-specific recombinase XerD